MLQKILLRGVGFLRFQKDSGGPVARRCKKTPTSNAGAQIIKAIMALSRMDDRFDSM